MTTMQDQDDDTADAAPDLSPLGDDATAADIAASAEAHAQGAAAARAQAGHARAEAEEIRATARERAGQILAAAEEQAGPLAELAAGADKEAVRLQGIAGSLDTAARVMAAAEQEDAEAAALWTERGRLTARVGELGAQAGAAQEQLQRLAARRGELETRLASAAGDDDLAIELSGKVSGIAETERQVTAGEERIAADLAEARARITAIDRQNLPLPPYPAERPPIGSRRFRAIGLCDQVWPGRPGEAERRPGRRALNGGATYAEPAPQPRQPRRQVVVGR